jgi:hypothetical protein
MTHTASTLAFCGAAAAAALVAWLSSPGVPAPEAFSDRGEPFFQEFTDPNAALSLEVVEFEEAGGYPRALKVLNRNGRWTIPSQFDYPADAADRLSETAAAMLNLRKDDFASDLPADHERLGVVDPLDVSVAALSGRGTRLTIRGHNERLLADIILGAEARPGYRYVRAPDRARVYLARVGELQVSTRFEDWIDRDVLQVRRDDIDEIVVRNYAIDERTDGVAPRELLRLRTDGGKWMLDGLQRGERLNEPAVNDLLTRLVGLRIVGVLPKPAGITATLARTAAEQRVSPLDVKDLARKGFYLTREGQLLSNEGEVVVHTRRGVFYTLRFGEVAPGAAAPMPAAPDGAKSDATDSRTGENRYLFIMAAYDPSSASGPRGEQETTDAQVRLLHARFAPWYYIISADDFSKLRPVRAALVLKGRSG